MSWLDRHLSDTVQYGALTGRNNDGDPTFAAYTPIAARVERDQTIVRGVNDEEIIASWRMATTVPLIMHSRVLVSGEVKTLQIVSQESGASLGGATIYEWRLA